jgi:hypothetical protein
MTVIGCSPVSRVLARERCYPRTTKISGAISASEFDRIAADMRQGAIFTATMLDHSNLSQIPLLPTALESRRETFVDDAMRRFADRFASGTCLPPHSPYLPHQGRRPIESLSVWGGLFR